MQSRLSVRRVVTGLFLVAAAAFSLTACNPALGVTLQETAGFNQIHGTSLDQPEAQEICSKLDAEGGTGKCAAVTAALNNAKLQGYQYFDNCYQAVDYLFAGRSDYDWAMHVVWRESRGNKEAHRPGSQYYGCVQASDQVRSMWLTGPWNDAYYAVLMLRTGADAPDGGHCHWNPPRYCA